MDSLFVSSITSLRVWEHPTLLAGLVAFGLMVVLFLGAVLSPFLTSSSSSSASDDEDDAVAKMLGPQTTKASKKKKAKSKKQATVTTTTNDDTNNATQTSRSITFEKEEAATTTTSKKKKKKKKGATAVVEEVVEAVTTAGKKKKKKKKAKVTTADATSTTTTNNNNNLKKATETPVASAVDDNEEDDGDDIDVTLLLKKKKTTTAISSSTATTTPNKKPEQAWVAVDKKNKNGSNNNSSNNNTTTATATALEPESDTHTITLNVTDAQKPLLLGPKGATIQGLQSTTGAKLDLQGEELLLTGTEPCIAHALQLVQDLLAERAHTVTLEGDDIGGSDGCKAILGKGGATIQSIQQATQCQLQVSVEQGRVVITGPSAEQIQQAEQLCRHAVFGECQDVMELHNVSTVMLVYGKEYSKIRSFQDETGCKLEIAKQSTTLKIRGSAEDVPRARAMVQAWLDHCQGEVLELDPNQVGAVYGKGGATIRTIQADTGAFLQVDDKHSPPTCRILGEPEAVQQAKALVLKALAGDMVQLQPGQVMEKMELDPFVVPSVIGRGGTKIRELQAQYGVQLQVAAAAPNAETRTLRLIGTPAAVQKARSELDTNLVQPLLKEKLAAQETERLAAEAGQANAWSNVPADEADGW